MINTQPNNDIVEDLQPSTKSNIDLAKLLDQMEILIAQHTVLPKDTSYALALWCASTYSINDFAIFPKLVITSPEKRCGKSTLLDLLSAISCKSFVTSNMTAATIYRLIDQHQPTLIIDEADTFIANSTSDMTGIINSGHGRNRAYVTRCDGDTHQVSRFSTWTPMVLASIGNLQETIMDRSIVVQMRRKKVSESVPQIPIDLFDQCKQIREELMKWSIDNSSLIKASSFKPSPLGNDRAVDNWKPLFVLADLAGSCWLHDCDTAYQSLTVPDEPELPTLLLGAIREIFKKTTVSKISSAQLVEDLTKDKDQPWCEYRNGSSISQSGVANMLKAYGIKPKGIRIGAATPRGYELKCFTDAFERYLPPSP